MIFFYPLLWAIHCQFYACFFVVKLWTHQCQLLLIYSHCISFSGFLLLYAYITFLFMYHVLVVCVFCKLWLNIVHQFWKILFKFSSSHPLLSFFLALKCMYIKLLQCAQIAFIICSVFLICSLCISIRIHSPEIFLAH